MVYSHADIKPGEDLKCGVLLPKRLQGGVDRVTAQVEAASSTNPTKYEFDIATEADYEYVQALGGSENANREIRGILNQVEGVYQSELLLQLRISFQHAWTMEDDPYTAINASDLLYEFIEHWNANFAAEENYDLAHIWTDRERTDFHIGGLAHVAVVCSVRSSSYGLSKRQTEIPDKYVTPAHEIGHNFGAVHPNEVHPPVPTCTNTIMTSGIFGGGNKQLTFCQFSRQQIATHVSGNNSCLVTQPIMLQPPTGLSATAASESRINLAWQDNSDSETGFIVQRRREGSGLWTQIGTTAADSETFSSGGLFPGSTYMYRVRAFNDMESSAFSNEAAATTLAGAMPETDWRIDTYAGRAKYGGDNGPANLARLDKVTDVAVDRLGNIYITDTYNQRVRRVDTSGIITTVAGTGERGYSGDGGPAVEARLSCPEGVALDGAGHLYIADTCNHRIRRVDASGIITTVAGIGERGYSGDSGRAVEARLTYPDDVAVDEAGNLYIADTRNDTIRRVDTAGTITTAAYVIGLEGIAVDKTGNLYIADSGNHRIRRMDTSGIITTVAGIGERGYSGDEGLAVEAQLNRPYDVAVDGVGNLYIVDSGNYRIRRVDTVGIITTVAGIGERGYSGDEGLAVKAQLNQPYDVAVDGVGNLYIADSGNYRIRQVDAARTITTIAGIGEIRYSGDGGPANQADLYYPKDVTVDRLGNLYIADTWNDRVRRVDTSGIITTVAGSGYRGYSGDEGPAVFARLNRPNDVAMDGAGNLYIADSWNNRIRRVDARGMITTIAGSGHTSVYGYSGDGGPAVEAELRAPSGVALDGSGNIYISDTYNMRIRRVDSTGIITTVAGSGGTGVGSYSGDGGPAVEARLDTPFDVAVADGGNLYIADSYNNRIRRVDVSGIITTVAGIGEGDYTRSSGPAVMAALFSPHGVAVDGAGNLYIADTNFGLIRSVDPSGTISTIAGPERWSWGFSGDGGPADEAMLARPKGVAVDSSGNVYVADTENHRIRVLTRASSFPSPTGLTATAVSTAQINLTWQDNSDGETGFRVQRRVDGSSQWVEIATTTANATTFSDTGLEPNTTYHYRVRAFMRIGFSDFSNEAIARTLEPLPPTLTRFTPTIGPVGVQVKITGAHFIGATAVEFNGISAARFEVVSETSIEAVVPAGATSGPISVVAPGGTAVSAHPFTVIDSGIGNRLFIPIVLRSQGRTPGSIFTSELTLTNRGTTTAAIHYTYTAAFGGGSGTAVDTLEPGRQRIIPDAIDYLTSLGVPIGSGSAGGTLAVDFSNLSSESAAAVTVRVTTPVEEGSGRAGLAFPGLTPDGLLTGPAFITGLRQNRQDRSNLAVQNAGDAGEGSITLKVTVFSGDPASEERSVVLPDLLTLKPGGFRQYNGILTEAGFDNGYVKVEQVEGAAPYYAYGVINDNFNSDGSFVFPVREDSLESKRGQTLPVIIETKDFASELTVTNFSPVPKTVDFRFVAEAVETDGDTAGFSLKLEAGEQRILPGIVDWLRWQEVEGIGAADEAFVGAVFATVAEGDMSGIVMGARTGSPDARGGTVQPLLQWGSLWFGLSRQCLDLWFAAERGEPEQSGAGQHGGSRRQRHHH